MKRRIQVVGAVIRREDLILCAQLGPEGSLAGKWEFPGGKIEPGESRPDALAREIREELGCIIQVGAPVERTVYEYPFAIIDLETYWCTLVESTPTASEHSALSWLPMSELSRLDWAAADIPAVATIERLAVDR